MGEKKEGSVNEDTALTRRDDQQGFFSELWQRARLVYKLLLDPEVPIYLKVLPFAAVVYILFPFDFIPDVIPGFGQLDDITILILGTKMFIDLAPKQVVARHLQNMRSHGDNIPTVDEQPVDELYSSDPDVIEGIIIEDSDGVDQVEDSEV
jgi:uncharacterized membrane protein YkvA (DUF1232 family)